MVRINIQYNSELANSLWPSFKPLIEDKHGVMGARGAIGEEHCMRLIEEYLPRYRICYDHSQDCVGQYFGIDLTCVTKETIDTIDCKFGKTGIYWDKIAKYWYITVKDDFFSKRKQNTHFMHVGPKGDLFVLYKKHDLFNHYEHLWKKEDVYGTRIKVNDIRAFSETNIT